MHKELRNDPVGRNNERTPSRQRFQQGFIRDAVGRQEILSGGTRGAQQRTNRTQQEVTRVALRGSLGAAWGFN
eukprot:6247983-Alexandrium_andersonii.AAC.1